MLHIFQKMFYWIPLYDIARFPDSFPRDLFFILPYMPFVCQTTESTRETKEIDGTVRFKAKAIHG